MSKIKSLIAFVFSLALSFSAEAFDPLANDDVALPLEGAVSLQQDFVAIGDNVTLGQLFDGVGLKSLNKVLASPKVGHDLTLNASELLKIARANQINWTPKTGSEKITISRKGLLISSEEITEAVLKALFGETQAEEKEITFTTQKMEFFAPLGKDYFLTGEKLSFNPRGGQFVVSLFMEVEGEKENMGRLTGKIFSVISAPVPNREMKIGEIITEQDLDFKKVRADLVRARDIIDATKLIGKSLKKNISLGELIRKDDITENYAVLKGKIVTVQFKSKNMTLTSQAKALENAMEGDSVKLMNQNSKQIFSAVVSGPNLATVTQAYAKM